MVAFAAASNGHMLKFCLMIFPNQTGPIMMGHNLRAPHPTSKTERLHAEAQLNRIQIQMQSITIKMSLGFFVCVQTISVNDAKDSHAIFLLALLSLCVPLLSAVPSYLPPDTSPRALSHSICRQYRDLQIHTNEQFRRLSFAPRLNTACYCIDVGDLIAARIGA